MCPNTKDKYGIFILTSLYMNELCQRKKERLYIYESTQQTHNVATTVLQCRCNVATLQRHCNNIVVTLYVYWVFWVAAWEKIYLRTFVPRKDSDQPVHPYSLTRAFAVNSLDSQESEVSSRGEQRLIRMLGCTLWSEASQCTHVKRYIFLCCSPYESESTEPIMLHWSRSLLFSEGSFTLKIL